MANGDWTPTPAPALPGPEPIKPVIYRSTAALWGILGLIGLAVITALINVFVQRPAAEIEEIEGHINTLNTAVAQMRQEILHITKTVSTSIPKRQEMVFERINQVTGRLAQLDDEMSRLALRDARPDPFLGHDAVRLEARITKNQERHAAADDKAMDQVRARLARVEIFCKIRPELQSKGPQR